MNVVLTAVFVMEMLLKLGLMGPIGYFRDGYNVFDFIITCLGLLEMIVKV